MVDKDFAYGQFITVAMLNGPWCQLDDCYEEMVPLILDFVNTANRPDGVWRNYADQYDVYLTQAAPPIQWP